MNDKNYTKASPRGQTRNVCRRSSVKTMLCAACAGDTVVKHDPMKCVYGLRSVDSPMRFKRSTRPFPNDVIEVVGVAVVECEQRPNDITVNVGAVITKRTANHLGGTISRVNEIVSAPIVEPFAKSIGNVVVDVLPFLVGRTTKVVTGVDVIDVR